MAVKTEIRLSAEDLLNMIDAGVIERCMLSDEERALVEAYEAEIDAMFEAHIAAMEGTP